MKCQKFCYVNKLLCSLHGGFIVGDLEGMQVISNDIIFAGKLPGMRVASCDICICKMNFCQLIS